GWIIDEEKSEIVEVSQAMCKLLKNNRADLVGLNIIGHEITEVMQNAFGNFYEMAVLEAILVHSLNSRFTPDPESSMGRSLTTYLSTTRTEFPRREAQVLAALAASDAEVSGRPYKAMLQQGFNALVNNAAWPEFHEGWLGFMPLIVTDHPSLTPGRTARFTKTVCPLTDHRPGVLLVRRVPATDPATAEFVKALTGW